MLSLQHNKLKPGSRFLQFHNWLCKFSSIREIIYEDVPRFESASSAKVYCGLLAVLQMFCLANGTRMSCIKANVVKKKFTGNGSADKFMMCDMAHQLGWRGGKFKSDIDHDECDAIAAVWVVLLMRETIPLFAHQTTLENA